MAALPARAVQLLWAAFAIFVVICVLTLLVGGAGSLPMPHAYIDR